MSQRVLVVDDDREIVRLARSFLENAGLTVLTAYDGESAWRTIHAERPDLVVLDLMLPKPDGWEITQRVRLNEKLASTPIVMLTARVEDTDKLRGFDMGADDYLTKPFNGDELVARVKAVLRRAAGALSPSHILEGGGLRVDIDAFQVLLHGALIDLTPTEFALLSALMKRPNHVFTRAELIEQALGYNYEGLDRTLDSHMRNLRKKLNQEPFIETVFGVGYRFRADQGEPRAE